MTYWEEVSAVMKLTLAQLFYSFGTMCHRLDPALPPLRAAEEIWLGDEALYQKMNTLALQELPRYRQLIYSSGPTRQALQVELLDRLWHECRQWLE